MCSSEPGTDTVAQTVPNTNSNGVYTFTNLPLGNYLVDVTETDGDLPSNYWIGIQRDAFTWHVVIDVDKILAHHEAAQKRHRY